MQNPGYPIPPNESKRLAALYSYNILDSIPESEYDAITRIAAHICQVPVSLITLLDSKRQWFKSRFGVDMQETPREIAFCNHTIMNAHEMLVVSDLRLDDRFSDNPLVTGEPNAVFYAGAPLVTPDGFVLGSICVLDAKAKTLTDAQHDALRSLAQQVITQLELRKKLVELKIAEEKLQQKNQDLKEFARLVSHDMKTPVANISMLSTTFKRSFSEKVDEDALEFMNLIESSAKELLGFIDDVLVKAFNGAKNNIGQKADSYQVITKVINMVAAPADIEIKLEGEFPEVNFDKTSLQQVFQNLLTNAIKYNDKPKGEIRIMCSSEGNYHCFKIADNGRGIAAESLEEIFIRNHTLDTTDRYGNKGTGFGLAIVKEIIENSGGRIDVQSKERVGSVFSIRIPQVA